jgi:D-alanine-D-alanine ligase
LSGYARIDLRLAADGKAYMLEANPNPNLSDDEDFAASAGAAGVSYNNLLQKLMTLGMDYKAAWRAS